MSLSVRNPKWIIPIVSALLAWLILRRRISPAGKPLVFQREKQLPSAIRVLLAFVLGAKVKPLPNAQPLTIRVVQQDTKENLKLFQSICGKAEVNILFLYPHCIAQRAFLTLLAHNQFPTSLIGAVHLKSYFKLYDREKLRSLLQQGAPVTVEARHSGTITGKDAKGSEVFVTLELLDGPQVLWKEVVVLFKAGAYLPEKALGIGIDGGVFDRSRFGNLGADGVMLKTTAKITGQETWSFGTGFGDVNPIHMSSLGAVLFGQSGRVAHGMHVIAKVLESLEVQLAESLLLSREWAVSFKGPVPVNSELCVSSSCANGVVALDISKVGQVKPNMCVRSLRGSAL
jgi:acyl dehydratase